MIIFPFAHDQTIAQMWSNGARGGCSQAVRWPKYGPLAQFQWRNAP